MYDFALSFAGEARDVADLLPIRLDDTELPGLNDAIGYVSYPANGIDVISELLIRKLGKPVAATSPGQTVVSAEPEAVVDEALGLLDVRVEMG